MGIVEALGGVSFFNLYAAIVLFSLVLIAASLALLTVKYWVSN